MKKKTPTRGHLYFNLVCLLLFIGAAIYLEMPRSPKLNENQCELIEREGTDESARSKDKMAAMGYREIRSRRVTMITLDAATTPASAAQNVCEQRWLVAQAIRQLDAARAEVVVLDKGYDPTACPKTSEGTIALLSAAQEVAAKIVVAAATHVPPVDPKGCCLILNPSLDFGDKRNGSGKAVVLGLTRLNADIRKIPLDWSVYSGDAAFSAHQDPTNDYQTLSYQAATFEDPHIAEEVTLKRLKDSGTHPLTIFIAPDKFEHGSAVALLCSGSYKAALESRYGLHCQDIPAFGAELAGRVVILGDDYPGRDQWQLLGRQVPGVYLQANYIESLLDGRYQKPLSSSWNITILIVWLFLLYFLFWVIQPEIALIVCAIVGAITWYLFLQILLLKGVYPDLWIQPLGIAALLLKYIDARGHRLGEMLHRHSPKAPH